MTRIQSPAFPLSLLCAMLHVAAEPKDSGKNNLSFLHHNNGFGDGYGNGSADGAASGSFNFSMGARANSSVNGRGYGYNAPYYGYAPYGYPVASIGPAPVAPTTTPEAK